MSLIFTWRDLKDLNQGLTFDDVLVVPAKSSVRSRRDPQLKSRLTKSIAIETPLISANMDTVTESAMAIGMQTQGGFGIIHRFMPIAQQVAEVTKIKEAGFDHVGASIGVNDDHVDRAKALVEAGVDIMTIDIAHGHTFTMMETIKWLKDTFAKIEVIAGNVATPEATMDLIEAGADAIKVGIGPGSMCTTRVITGCGVPQVTAIALCAEVGRTKGIPIIADGGMRTSGDVFKAFAAGAESVMLGSMLSGTIETPGEIKKGKKQYRGMASKAAQVSWRGGVPTGMAAEGESTMVPVKGHVKDVILEITGGIRSAMAYINANEFNEIHQNARFIQMSHAGVIESGAHGLMNS